MTDVSDSPSARRESPEKKHPIWICWHSNCWFYLSVFSSNQWIQYHWELEFLLTPHALGQIQSDICCPLNCFLIVKSGENTKNKTEENL